MKDYFLRFLIRGEGDDLIFWVSEKELDRLSDHLQRVDQPDGRLEFFWFDTMDGKSVIINFTDVQAARCLWEPVRGPRDRTQHDGPVQIKLRGRSELLEDNSYEEATGIYDLFAFLKMGPGSGTFHSFLDEDGETLFLNEREVVWIVAPLRLIKEGKSQVLKETESE